MSIPSGRGPGAGGDPFGGEYRRLRAGQAVTSEVQQAIRRQVDELALRKTDAGLRRRLNTAVQDRWIRSRGTQLAVRRKDRGEDAIVISGELLLTTRTWEDPVARAYVTRRGLSPAPVGCADLESRLVRVVTSGPTTPEHLEDTVAELRARGFAASLTHITPLSPVMKTSSAVAAPAAETFPDYVKASTGDGSGARVAVVDTGIDAVIRGDGWLTEVPRQPVDDTATDVNDVNIDPLDNDPADGLLDLSAGHGTFVSGIVVQVAPGVDLSVYRALSAGGTGSEIEVACKLIAAVRDGAQLVNLSLGTQTQFDQPSLAIAAALEVVREIEKERGEDVLIVAAAGNFGDTVPTWPAAFRRVVAVGSLTADLRPSVFSSRGWWVDCATVGEGILSPYVAGEQSPDFTNEPATFGPDSFARWSGTSFAAPQIVGAVARLMHERGLDARAAYIELLALGRPLPDFGQAFSILPGV
ncbi:S8 family peptidase [Cellulomonas terrae]|uniref:Protease n=1 Tax=Cellulomonas terrae TaxID=311234 RepID=A0A511JFA8_9CELL|nr:S8 family serine peptidase [Cellulomonas terrae]GEL96688.1 protease [Cellulomonas terrae]